MKNRGLRGVPPERHREGFVYNQAGLLIGPLRQCYNATGKPKEIFESLEKAEEFVAAHGGKIFPYTCTFGHVHLSSKTWTRPKFYLAEGEEQ